jgi:ATP-binding cassette subfamily C (CFTR/MRP) protein 1
VLDLVASLALVALVHFEHFKSIRPSLLSCAFISVTVLLDVARLRSAWMQLSGTGWTASVTASLVAKLLLLALESLEKGSLLLLASDKALSKESIGGPFNRALFLWLNNLLKTGWQAVLRPDTLPAVDERLDVDVVFERLHHSWLSG